MCYYYKFCKRSICFWKTLMHWWYINALENINALTTSILTLIQLLYISEFQCMLWNQLNESGRIKRYFGLKHTDWPSSGVRMIQKYKKDTIVTRMYCIMYMAVVVNTVPEIVIWNRIIKILLIFLKWRWRYSNVWFSRFSYFKMEICIEFAVNLNCSL